MRAFDYLLRELQFTPEQLADVIQAAATAQSTADGAVSNAATAQAWRTRRRPTSRRTRR